MAGEERWVGVDDVATHLGVAKDSVYRWIEGRGLPAHRGGRLFRIKLSEIDEWVSQDKEQEQVSNPVQSRPVLTTKTNKSTKARSWKMLDRSVLMIRQAMSVAFVFQTAHWKRLSFRPKRWRLSSEGDPVKLKQRPLW